MALSNKLVASIVLLIATLLFFLSPILPEIFTEDNNVVQIASNVLKLATFVYLIDSLQVYLCGPIRALGVQS